MTATVDNAVADLQRANAELQRQLAERTAERDEALERETATAEVLQVINASPGDLTPVFEAILEKAHSLCGAAVGSLGIFDGETWRAVVQRGYGEPLAERLRQGARGSDNPFLQSLLDGARLVHIPDLAQLDYPIARANVEARIYTLLLVPLRKDDALLGTISIARREVRPFSDKQIALLQNFAAQAVIAMENARLITETREALDQQTATAEVLGVINSSPGDLAPVFDAMLGKAMRLCEAETAHLLRYENGAFNRAASFGVAEDFDKILPLGQPLNHLMNHEAGPMRVLASRAVVHMRDTREDQSYLSGSPAEVAAVEQGGIRTALFVPLLHESEVVGCFVMHRLVMRAFSGKQIALLENFAAQAVIAIENARLITETREALDQQTATAEVLQVINSSPGDLMPVLDAMVERAARLCEADEAAVRTFDGELLHLAAAHGSGPEVIERLRQLGPTPANGLYEPFASGARVVHIADVRETVAFRENPVARQRMEVRCIRTWLAVALHKDGVLLGVINVHRHVVRPFSDTQIGLLQSFAAQAVIAMENARLITETREALDQQTATAEVLQVINSSPGDLAPVFDAMLDKALTLCGAAFGQLNTYDGEGFRTVAVRGEPRIADWLMQRGRVRPGPGTTMDRLSRGDAVVQIADVTDDEGYRRGDPTRRALVEIGGCRTMLSVALRKDDALLGAITVYRQEVRPFSDKQIALLQNFAAQAVIAMENARLITETREALERQTATAEVLRVISSSATDVQPVFDAIVERAIKLCDAEFTAVARYEDDGLLRLVATSNLSPDETAAFQSPFPRAPTRGFIMGRAFLECRPVVVEDVLSDPDYDQSTLAAAQSLTKYRTFLGVPIMREDKAIGVIGCARREVRPFTPAQIELVSTFADQAMIAIENARLLGEIQQRQAELRVTFDNMADGVVMFDETLHLAAWNRNFQELLDLSDAVLAARPSYADYLRALAERGEFGSDDIEAELGRRLEHTDEELRLERTRPDGRVIEVRRNAVPDGGFVLIYSDITERKRSEEEIRAARDVAEATLRDLRAAQANLIQAEKMASLGQLTAGIAHEIKNPLNFVNNFASLSVELLDELKETAAPALATLADDKRADVDDTMELLTGNLEKIAEHGKRADNIVKSMLEHSRGVSGERREVDLNNLIDEALNLAYHGARAQDQCFNITLERDYAQSLKPIELAPQEMTRVFLNLFGNGFYAATKRARENDDGSFRPSLSVTTGEEKDAIEVRIRDNGTGIPPEIKDKLFQPFFTTKPTGEGTGLGLSISYDIVMQQHGGTITVESEPGAFTEFIIRLPRH